MRMKFRFEAGATDPKDFVFFVLPLAMVIKTWGTWSVAVAWLTFALVIEGE